MDRNSIILLCVATYMLVCVAIGIWAMRRTHSTRDFFMASRNLGFVVTAVAMFSSIMSGFGFVGGPGLMYRMGTSSFWILVTSPVGFALAFFLLAKRLRMIAELRESISLPDVAQARFQHRGVPLMVALAILCGVVAYLAVQIKAMAVVLQEIFAKNDIPGHESILLCVTLSTAVLVFYCVTGGVIASVYTDLFQGTVMAVVAVFVFLTTIGSVEDGLTTFAKTIFADNPESVGPWGTLGMIGCLSWYFVFSVGIVGQPHIISKLMMTRRVEDARFTLPVTLLGYAMTAMLWVSIGLLMRTLVLSGQHPELARADDAAAEFLYHFASPLLAGLTFAGLFAAVMSTADGFLSVGAAALVHDIPRSFRGQSLRRELLWARLATVGLAVVAAVFAFASSNLIGILGAYGWGVFSAALVPVLGIGLNWKRATAEAAMISIGLSLAVNAIGLVLQLWQVPIPYGVSAGAIALIVSLITFVGVSFLTAPRQLSPDIDAVMDL